MITKIRISFLFWGPLLLCALGSFCSQAQTLDQHASADSLEAGDVFNYSITLKKDQSYDRIIYPDSSLLKGDFELRSRKKYRIADFKDSLSYRLQFWATKDTTIPALPVKLISGTDTTVLYTQPVPIGFVSVLSPRDKKLRPLKPIFNFAAAWWPYLLGLLVLLLVIAIGYYVYQKYAFKPEPAPTAKFTPQPFLNPLKELENNLRQLKDVHPQNEAQFEQFYISLGNAIRLYIKQMYSIPAMESSSREIIHELNRRAVDEQLIKQSRIVFREADLVKFANFEATKEQAEESYKKGEDFLTVAKQLHGRRIQEMKRQHLTKVQEARKAFNEQREEVHE